MIEPFMLKALTAGCLIAIIAGFLGCIIVWRRLACFSDSIAHGILPGLALGFLWNIDLTWSAFFTAILIAMFIEKIKKRSVVSIDTLLIIISQIMFSVGVIIMYQSSDLNNSLMNLLLGDILSVSLTDLAVISAAAAVIITLLIYNWNKIVLICISEEIALSEGINLALCNILIMLLTAVFTAISLQTVGIILAGSVLLIPATAARFFASSPRSMPYIACAIGVFGTSGGITASYFFDVPTAPTIVISLGAILFVSFFFKNNAGSL